MSRVRSGTTAILVAEFHNGESIARLVRAALRREIASVTLTSRPRGAGLHQLVLKLQGEHCVTLGAEPVGRDDSGRYKLLLAPLHAKDEVQLREIIRQHAGTDPSPTNPSERPPQTRPLDSKIFDMGAPLPNAPAEEVQAPRAQRTPSAAPPAEISAKRPSAPPLHGADASDPSVSRAIIMDAGALGLGPDEDADDDDALTVPGRPSMVPGAPIGPDGAFPPPPLSPTQNVVAPGFAGQQRSDASISITAQVDSTKPSQHADLEPAERRAAVARMGLEPEEGSRRERGSGDRPTTKRIRPIPEGLPRDPEGPDSSEIEVIEIEADFEQEDDTLATGIPSTAPSRVNPALVSRPAVPTPKQDSAPRTSKFDPRRTMRDPIAGRTLAAGKYAVQGIIGAGAIGAVYRGVQPDLERPVAIKVLHPGSSPDAVVLARFRKEALTASQVDHRNITRIHDFGQEPDGLVYIVMELLAGRSLQQHLDEEKRLAPTRVIHLMMQVCAALSAAHERGVVHRDVKPDNVVLVAGRDDDGDEIEIAKVCDFGIATLHGRLAQDEEGFGAGTPDYMAPEQARRGNVDARADVYACGAMLFELVVGRPPFEAESAAGVLAKHASEPPPRPSALTQGLPTGYDAIVLRALAKDPSERFQSARELRAALKALAR